MAKRNVFVGVDVGGTKILACPVMLEGKSYKILAEEKKKTKPWKGIPDVIDRIVESVKESLKKANLTLRDVNGIGLGLPGAVDAQEGIVLFAPNIEWKKVQLKKILEAALQVPCFLDNDVNLGTFGEQRYGAGAGVKTVIGVFWGTGIGGGIIIDGRIHRGLNFTAGEVGHMIMKIGGRKCGCGNRGCLEALASRTAMSAEILEKIDNGKKTRIKLTDEDRASRLIKSGTLQEAFEEGDKLVTDILTEAAETIGAGVATLVNLLSPEMIIIGGGVVESMGPSLMPIIKESAQKNAFPFAFKGVKIAQAKLGDYAVLVGAALFAQEELARRQDEGEAQ
jgi:glucokinase